MNVTPQPNPYGPRSGQPNPYGQPSGPPGNYGPPPGLAANYGPPRVGYGSFPAPPPVRKRRLWLKIGLPVLLVTAFGISWVGLRALNSSPAIVQAGDCVNVMEVQRGDHLVAIDCADPSANMKVAVRLDDSTGSCPAVGYDEFYGTAAERSFKLCLTINARQGDCFANVLSGNQKYQRVSCTDPTAEIEFVKVVEGRVDTGACQGTGATKTLSYPQPPTTLCMRLRSAI